MTPGLQRGTRQWLFAIRAYYAGDNDIVAVCEELEAAWDQIEALKKGPNGKETIGRVDAEYRDDEWASGG